MLSILKNVCVHHSKESKSFKKKKEISQIASKMDRTLLYPKTESLNALLKNSNLAVFDFEHTNYNYRLIGDCKLMFLIIYSVE